MNINTGTDIHTYIHTYICSERKKERKKEEPENLLCSPTENDEGKLKEMNTKD